MFKLQETEMMDPELDYTLMRVCKQMIKVMVVCSFKRVRLGYKSSVSFELLSTFGSWHWAGHSPSPPKGCSACPPAWGRSEQVTYPASQKHPPESWVFGIIAVSATSIFS